MESKIKKYELNQNGKKYILSIQIYEEKLRFACIEYYQEKQAIFIGEFTLTSLMGISSIFSDLTEISKALEIFDSLILNQKVVYAVCVGLGFASMENIMYVFGDEDWFSTAIVRALLAVPGHYAFAILMGYYYSIYHFVDHSPKVAVCVLLVPVLAHGTYDALAMSGIVSPVIGGLSFFVLIYFCVKMHKVAKEKVLALVEKGNDRIIV